MPARLINEEQEIADALGFGESYAKIVRYTNIINGLIAGIFVMSGALIGIVLAMNVVDFENLYLWSSIIAYAFVALGIVINYRESVKEKRKIKWETRSEGMTISSDFISLLLFYIFGAYLIVIGYVSSSMLELTIGVALIIIGAALNVAMVKMANSSEASIDIWRTCNGDAVTAEIKLNEYLGGDITCGAPTNATKISKNGLNILFYCHKSKVSVSIYNITKKNVKIARTIKEIFDALCEQKN